MRCAKRKNYGNFMRFRDITSRENLKARAEMYDMKYRGTLTSGCAKIFSSYQLIARIRYKHRNPLRAAIAFALLGIICRFTTECDTISPVLRRKRSPVLPARRFVRGSRPPDVRNPFPRALTPRIRCKQVFALFAKRDARHCAISSSLNTEECLIKKFTLFLFSKNNCISKNLTIRRISSIYIPKTITDRPFKVRHSRLPAATEANENVAGRRREWREGGRDRWRRRARRVKPSRNGFAISYESLVTE